MTTEIEEKPTSPKSRFQTALKRVAHALNPGSAGAIISAGDLASLRRGGGSQSPIFYKFASALLHDELSVYRGEQLDEAERRWARIFHLLARSGGVHSKVSFGAAVGGAQVAESRLVRLLRAEGDAVEPAARACLAPLVQRAVPFDPVDLGALILSAPHSRWRFHFEESDAVRRRIARDYYRALAS